MNLDILAKKIEQYVELHKNELIAFFTRYLSNESTNPDLDVDTAFSLCNKELAKELEELHIFDKVDYWEIDEKYSNLVATKIGEVHSPILYCGHTDTVPVTETQLAVWRDDAGPFSGKRVNGLIYGRGATDMKSGNAASLMAVKVLSELDIPLQYDSYFGFVMTEESGNRKYGVDSIVNRGYKADSAIVMEPTHLKIVPAVQGEFYFKITIKGKSSHIASRYLSIYPNAYDLENIPGVNAIDLMRDMMSELDQLESQLGLYARHELMAPGATTINISGISSKGIFSAMAEECSIIGSMIYTPSMSQQQAVSEFNKAIERVTQRHWWLREHPPILELPYFLSEKPPVNIDKNHWICDLLETSFSMNNMDIVYDAMISTSDANYLIDHGIDTITFGPGSSDMGMHGYNERIPEDEYLSAIKVYACMMALKSKIRK